MPSSCFTNAARRLPAAAQCRPACSFWITHEVELGGVELLDPSPTGPRLSVSRLKRQRSIWCDHVTGTYQLPSRKETLCSSPSTRAARGRRARRHGTNQLPSRHRHVASADLIDHRRHWHTAGLPVPPGLVWPSCCSLLSAPALSAPVSTCDLFHHQPPPARSATRAAGPSQRPPVIFVVSHVFTLRRAPHTAFPCSRFLSAQRFRPSSLGLGRFLPVHSSLNFTREPIAGRLSSEKSFKKSASFVLSRDLHFPLQLMSAGF